MSLSGTLRAMKMPEEKTNLVGWGGGGVGWGWWLALLGGCGCGVGAVG